METKLHPVLTIRIFASEKCFGPGLALLLHRVEELHSLRAAAQSMNMAYSKAWTILRTSQKELGFPLLESTTGGKNGGGAVLTEQAKTLLTEYDAYCREVESYAEKRFTERFEKII